MIPGNAISPTPRPAPFIEPQNDPSTPLVDVEMGSLALNDPTGGLLQKLWTAYMDGDSVMLKADGVAPVALFVRSGITLLSLAFDQNMRPFIAFVDGAGAHYWWFDPAAGDVVIADLPAGTQYPRCTLDDKRPEQVSDSDIILSYIRAGNLYYCQQRDRFGTEYPLSSSIAGTLASIGFNEENCFQFAIAPS